MLHLELLIDGEAQVARIALLQRKSYGILAVHGIGSNQLMNCARHSSETGTEVLS